MEGFLDALGLVSLLALILIGALAGTLAGRIAGKNKLLYVLVGIVAAVATPFVLAAVGISIVAIGGVFLLLIVGLIGAAIVLALVRAIFGK